MGNLASTYQNQGQWDEAVTLEEKVLEVSKAVLGEWHPDTLKSKNNLAETYRAQGKIEKVARIQEEVLKNTMQILGNEHPDTLSLYHTQIKGRRRPVRPIMQSSSSLVGRRQTSNANANRAETKIRFQKVPRPFFDEETPDKYKTGGFYPVRVGEIFHGQYEVIRKLAVGSYSTVWLTDDIKLLFGFCRLII